ncbi:hypothetical protein BGZ94_002567 [Podila epigama]|nr:hypothetical protein BGZ94_002567 [Podila epigama]
MGRLHTGPRRGGNANTTLEESYEELRQAATQFMTIQIGVSTFKYEPDKGAYVAKPFNFYIYPTTSGGFSPQGRCFMTEASSLDFLANNGFDFNNWIYHDRITKWLADGKALNFINIQTANGYQKKLVHQETRRRWGDTLTVKGNATFVTITKEFDFQRSPQFIQNKIAEAEVGMLVTTALDENVSRDIKNAIGFRAVIDLLSKCGKPIVGHNIVIDLAYILAQFVGPLPPTVQGYKKMIHETFPIILDTKYISYTAPHLQGLAYETSLGGLENMVHGVQFMNSPRINLDIRHPRYIRNDHSHEAGYDAYTTGVVLIKILAYISQETKKLSTGDKKETDDTIASAAEEEAYESYDELFDRLLAKREKSSKPEDIPPPLDFNDRAITVHKNILHWGRSQSGSFNIIQND